MPEHRLERTRRAYGPDDAKWRRPSDTAADQIDRRLAAMNEFYDRQFVEAERLRTFPRRDDDQS